MMQTIKLDMSFLDPTTFSESQLQLVMAALVILSCLVVITVIFRFAIVDSFLRLRNRYPIISLLSKAFAIAGTFLLACSDYFSVKTIFSDASSITIDEAKYLAVTFAGFLEGFAFILGIFLSRLTDPTNYKKGDKFANWVGVIVSALALFGAWGLSIWQRINLLTDILLDEMAEGATVTFADILTRSDPEQVFMMVSPVLTSVLAFGLSWVAFPHNSLDSHEQEVRYWQNRYLRYSKRYKKQLLRFQEKKVRLWTTLVGESEEPLPDMPADSNIFQARCQQLIRQKTVNACLSSYSDEFSRFNKEFESQLNLYIQELAARSTIPHEIASITPQEVLDAYDLQMQKHDLTCDQWDSMNLRLEKLARLQKELDNAACRAEFRFNPKKK